ncbi:MAG: ribbon-helix-helix protein, CopG family [Phycisphaerales bacterium]|nr:MAG: ribbon-helix-helix protein, CopG family [Phycisphaerales bacterium]
MSESISIRLSPELRRELNRAAKRQKRPASEITREALRRYLAVEEFRAIRAKTLPFAEAQGILTDEDVFKLIS